MPGPLTYIHLFAAPLLLLPLISLCPAPKPPPPELPGIRPITVRRITPRRGFILTFLILLAFTSFLDGALLVTDLLTASSRNGSSYLFKGELDFAGWVVYAVGGLIIWSLTAIVVDYRAKWGDKGVIVLATWAFLFEIPNLVFLIMAVTHAVGSWKILSILAIIPSGLRLLILPILFVVVSTPKISYEPTEETTALLNNDNTDVEPGPSRGREAYGTFSSATTKTSNDSRDASNAPGTTGINTPATKGAVPIPKQLGAVKKEDKPLDWRQVWARIRKLSPYLWPSTSRRLQLHVAICVILLIAGRVLQPMLPLSLGRVVRALTKSQGTGSGSSVWPPFIAYFIIRVTVSGSGLLYFVQQRLWVPVAQYSDREMMMLCFNHLLNLSLAYHTKRNTGEVLKVIDRGSAINNLFQTVLFTALPTVFDIVIAFGVFYYLYGGLLAAMTLTVMGLYLFVSVFATQRRAVTRRLLMDRDIKQRGIISDVLTNWESVKYFTAEQRESTRFREAVVSYQETEAKWNIDYQLLYLAQTFLLALGLLSGSLLISYRVLHGTADAAEFVVYIQYFLQLSNPLDRLGFLYQQLNRNSIDAEKLFNLLGEVTEINDKPDAKELIITDGVVEFDNVRFSYDGKVQALKGVSFKIDKGESMALVGESGSGKSTVLRLLYRFYDIDSGVIRIDGQDISKVTQLSLRRAIGIVPQDSVLWNDTIGANISYGKEGAEDDEIIAAAQAAKLHDRILGFTEGYSTIVGERGIRLSGGEKQRVSLARMFLKSPAILVLDEATSALDTETEREIQKALSELAKGRTSLSIAHRLSTIINSDQIVVMKDGQVIENGGYKALLEQDGAFATMWKKQIFTEAEMMAQANASGSATPEVRADSEHLIELSDDKPDNKPSGPTGGDVQAEVVAERQVEDKVDKADEVGRAEHADVEVDSAAVQPESARDEGVEVESAVPAGETSAASAAKGFDVPETAPAPSTYADAVKVASTDDATTTNDLPEVAHSTTAEPKTQDVPEPAAAPVPSVPFPAGPSAPPKPSEQASTSPSPARSPSTTTATPEKRISFPPMPRMSTSQSVRSNLSEGASASSSPSRNTSGADLPDASTSPEDTKADKRRKRLSSIKGFVRRISDQGASISRSNSLGGGGRLKSPMSEVEDPASLAGVAAGAGLPGGSGSSSTAGGGVEEPVKDDGKKEKRKKRLSLKGGK